MLRVNQVKIYIERTCQLILVIWLLRGKFSVLFTYLKCNRSLCLWMQCITFHLFCLLYLNKQTFPYSHYSSCDSVDSPKRPSTVHLPRECLHRLWERAVRPHRGETDLGRNVFLHPAWEEGGHCRREWIRVGGSIYIYILYIYKWNIPYCPLYILQVDVAILGVMINLWVHIYR